MKFMKVCSVIVGILMICAGIYCIFNPGITYLMLGYAVGVSMLFDAFGRIAAWAELKKDGQADGWMLVGGILSAVCGVVLVVNSAAQLFVDAFIAYFTAFWILSYAVITIIRSFRVRRFHRKLDTRYLGKYWWVGLIMGALLAVFAILSILNPIIIATSIGIFMGLGIITAGANMITVATTPSDKTAVQAE